MALEQFLELTGITGEASAPDARGSIPIVSWSFGVSREQESSFGVSREGESAARFRRFRFCKPTDSSTPLLMALCSQGAIVPQAKLLARSMGHRDPRLVIDLREVAVVDVMTSHDRATGELFDEVALRFTRLWVGGAVVDRRGIGDQVNWFAWDLANNRPATN